MVPPFNLLNALLTELQRTKDSSQVHYAEPGVWLNKADASLVCLKKPTFFAMILDDKKLTDRIGGLMTRPCAG